MKVSDNALIEWMRSLDCDLRSDYLEPLRNLADMASPLTSPLVADYARDLCIPGCARPPRIRSGAPRPPWAWAYLVDLESAD